MPSFGKKKLIVGLATLGLAIAARADLGQWSYVAHMNHPRYGATAAFTNGNLYVFGGEFDFSLTLPPYVEEYDPGTDTWTDLNQLPDTRYALTAVTLPNGHIALLGGFNGAGIAQDSYFDYDPGSDSYSNPTTLPTPGVLIAAAMGNDGNLWALIPDGSDVGQLYVYDLSNSTWTYKGQEPSGLGELTVATQGADGLIYFMGGVSNGLGTKAVYSYDAIHDAWTQQPDMNNYHLGFGAVTGGDHRIYAFGGVNDFFSFGGSYDGAEIFLPGNDYSWTTIESLETPRGLPAFASDPHTGAVYAIGGEFDGSASDEKVLDSVEVLQPWLLHGFGTTFNSSEGVSFSGDVATFTDDVALQTAADITARISWGDGTETTGTITGSNGHFTVSGSHTYVEGGTYGVGVGLEQYGGVLGVASTAFVADAPLSSNFNSFGATDTVPFSGKVATFTDSNPIGKLGDYTATVDWGDGSTSSGTVTADVTSGFDVGGGHTYATAGSKTVKVKITDNGGATTTAQGTVTVAEPPPVVGAADINGVEGAQFSGVVGSFTDADSALGADSFSATITWGDGVTSSGVVVSNGVGGFNVSGKHTYAEEGSYPTGISVSVSGGSPGSGAGVANIADAPINATGYSLIAKLLKFSGQVASFTDGNPHATVADFSAHIAWGDGGNSAGTISFSSGAFHVVGTHTYPKKGKYVVTIFIGDVGGSSTSTTTNINVGPVK